MCSKLRLVFAFCLIFMVFSLKAQETYWVATTANQSKASLGIKQETQTQTFLLNEEAFLESLSNAITSGSPLYFPNSSGTLEGFRIQLHPVLSPALAAKYPNITAYRGTSEVDTGHHVYFAVSPKGVSVTFENESVNNNAQPSGLSFLEKDRETEFYVRSALKVALDQPFNCETLAGENISKLKTSSVRLAAKTTIKTYRLAVSTTGEYTAYHGGTVEGALAAINATVTRINVVFNKDLGIQLSLVANTTNVIYTDPITDPYENNLNAEVQAALTANIGEDNYDVGHLFHRDENNGNAGYIGSVCQDNKKGSAFSSGEFPEGNTYDIDYVSHEMGHQFGANHTWSFESEGTNVQVEPGSGSTIMSYAGIVGGENVAGNSSDYFNVVSILQIADYLNEYSCVVNTISENDVPVIAPLNNYDLPLETPFLLSGSATDTSGNASLTYAWEQADNGVVPANVFGPENPVGAAFRSLSPTKEPYRYFPKLTNLSLNRLTTTSPATTDWETLATIPRAYTFYFTVRDNAAVGAGLSYAKTNLNVLSNVGPFKIRSQNETTTYPGGSKIPIIWDVARTNGPELNTKTLTALLSKDNGLNFNHTLAKGILNDGAVSLVLPNETISQARIMLKAENNPFFAINLSGFAIDAVPVALFFEQTTLGICNNSNATTEGHISYTNENTQAQLVFENLPNGVTVTPNIGSISGTLQPLSLSWAVTPQAVAGTYTVTAKVAVQGQSSSTLDFILNLWDTTLEATVLKTPLNASTEVSSDQELVWSPVFGATAYEVQWSKTLDFSTNTLSITTEFNQIYLNDLESGTLYYWRVKPLGECSLGSFTPPFSFSVATETCLNKANDLLPITIGSNRPNTINASIEFLEDLSLNQLEVILDIDHTYIADLIIKLYSPSGKVATLVSSPCGAFRNIKATFSDDGGNISCNDGTPAITGNVKPLSGFELFAGESIKGVWRLEIEDVAIEDGGQLNTFEMKVCAGGAIRPDADQDGVYDDTDDQCLDTPLGDTVDTKGCSIYRLNDNNFAVTLNSQSCSNITDGTIGVEALLSMDYAITIQNESGNTIRQGNFTNSYLAEFLAAGTYSLCITGSDATTTYLPQCFKVAIGAPEPLSVLTAVAVNQGSIIIDLAGSNRYFVSLNGQTTTHTSPKLNLDLKEGINTLKITTGLACQGVYEEQIYYTPKPTVYPNPVTTVLYIQTPYFENPEMKIQIHLLSGSLIKEININATQNPMSIDTSNWAPGVYVISVWLDETRTAYKILKE